MSVSVPACEYMYTDIESVCKYLNKKRCITINTTNIKRGSLDNITHHAIEL